MPQDRPLATAPQQGALRERLRYPHLHHHWGHDLRGCAEAVLGEARVSESAALIERLEQAPDLKSLMALVAGGGAQAAPERSRP